MEDNYGYADDGWIKSATLDTDRPHTVIVACEGEGWGQGLHLCLDSDAQAEELLISIRKVFGRWDLSGEGCTVLRSFGSRDEIGGLRSHRTGRTWSLQAWHERCGYPDADPLKREYLRLGRDHDHLMRRARETVDAIQTAAARYRKIDGESP